MQYIIKNPKYIIKHNRYRMLEKGFQNLEGRLYSNSVKDICRSRCM